MTDDGKARLNRLTSGVPTLDAILGGGLPEYSFNLIAGDPGAGKTTLIHQTMFANATPNRPALYFTVIGEPPIKMLRYQQQFSFFDPDKLNDGSIHFVNLSQEATEDLGRALDLMLAEVERRNPGIVVVDSFRSLAMTVRPHGDGLDLGTFVQRLALHMTSMQATTFLIGEYANQEAEDLSLFTIADGILWLSQNVNRNSMVRRCRPSRCAVRRRSPDCTRCESRPTASVSFLGEADRNGRRGTARTARVQRDHGPGRDDGGRHRGRQRGARLRPAGSGKPTVAIQFLAEGAKHGDPGVLAMFEETPLKYLEQAVGFGIDLQAMTSARLLKQVYMRPLDLSVDETLYEIQSAVNQIGAKRVVIDSLTGLEIALAPSFAEDFREIAVPTDRGADERRHHDHDDGGEHRQLHRAPLQPARRVVHDERHHPSAIRGNRQSAETDHDRHQDAEPEAQ